MLDKTKMLTLSTVSLQLDIYEMPTGSPSMSCSRNWLQSAAVEGSQSSAACRVLQFVGCKGGGLIPLRELPAL